MPAFLTDAWFKIQNIIVKDISQAPSLRFFVFALVTMFTFVPRFLLDLLAFPRAYKSEFSVPFCQSTLGFSVDLKLRFVLNLAFVLTIGTSGTDM